MDAKRKRDETTANKELQRESDRRRYEQMAGGRDPDPASASLNFMYAPPPGFQQVSFDEEGEVGTAPDMLALDQCGFAHLIRVSNFIYVPRRSFWMTSPSNNLCFFTLGIWYMAYGIWYIVFMSAHIKRAPRAPLS